MDPYLYPGTNVLRNIPGIQDPHRLATFEANASSFRLLELGEKPLSGKFDRAHLLRIHYHIFQDIYPWAGEIRTVEIAKANTLFALARHIAFNLDQLLDRLAKADRLRGLKVDAFCKAAAFYLGEINAIHPFREGNGRTQREFLRHLAVRNGYDFDWSSITRNRMIDASRESFRGSNAGLERILLDAISSPPESY